MIAYMLNAETKAAVVAALVEHGADPRMSGPLGRVPRAESPLAVSDLIAALPPAADGMFDITLSNTPASSAGAHTLRWRSPPAAVTSRTLMATASGSTPPRWKPTTTSACR